MNTSQIPLSIFSIEAKVDFAVRCMQQVVERHPEDPLFEGPLANLRKSVQLTVAAIASNRKRALTTAINEAHRRRGRCFIRLRKHIEAEQFCEEDSDEFQAAELLMEIIRRHGTQLHLARMSAESSLLSSLFEELEGDSARAALDLLGLNPLLEKLRQAQQDFAAVQVQRGEIELVKNVPTKLEAQKDLVKNLFVLLRGIDFLADSRPEIYEETGSLITVIASNTVTSERIRRGKPKPSPESSEPVESSAVTERCEH